MLQRRGDELDWFTEPRLVCVGRVGPEKEIVATLLRRQIISLTAPLSPLPRALLLSREIVVKCVRDAASS